MPKTIEEKIKNAKRKLDKLESNQFIDKRMGKIIADLRNRIKELKKLEKHSGDLEEDVPGIKRSFNKNTPQVVGIKKKNTPKKQAKIEAQKRNLQQDLILKPPITKKAKIKRRYEEHWMRKGRKPRILLLSDVKGWAWWIKSQYLIKYLSEEFKFSIINVVEDRNKSIKTNSYDLYFTFGWAYISRLGSIPIQKRLTGVTAHRPSKIIKSKMRLAGTLHANSMLLYNELRSMGFKNVFYVPNGVDEKLFRIVKPIPKERNNIMVGHVGKKSPRKGQEKYIIPAINKAKADSKLHMNRYTNRIPHDKMYKIYQDMDVFIVASKEDGTPNPALEAAACGRPIISNRIGNMPEFIIDGYNGFLVPKKVEAYVEKINYLKNNRDKLIEMGLNARKTIEEDWTWKMQAERYRTMFRDALERSR